MKYLLLLSIFIFGCDKAGLDYYKPGKTPAMLHIQEKCGVVDSDVVRTTVFDKISNCLNKTYAKAYGDGFDDGLNYYKRGGK